MRSVLEATAPCRLELVGGPLDGLHPDGVARLAVALDRRVFCRVEPREAGLELHSKDTGERVVADDARELTTGPGALVARILVEAGVHSGLRVVTQVRVPEDAGLGTSGALEVAVLGALGLAAAEIVARDPAKGAPGPDLAWSEVDRQAALVGGAHALRFRGGASSTTRLDADPARLEECLSLADPGPGSPQASPPSARGRAGAAEVAEALGAGVYADVAGLLRELHAGRFDLAPPAVQKLVEAIHHAGGAAWPSGRLIAVWAVPGAHAPGPREAVAALLKGAGIRSFPARVDLRGLEVE